MNQKPLAGNQVQPWVDALLAVARHYRLDCSEENIRLEAVWSEGRPLADVLGQMARQVGLSCRVGEFDAEQLSAWRLPLVVELEDDQVAGVETLASDGRASVLLSRDGGLRPVMGGDQPREAARGMVSLRPARAVPAARLRAYLN